MFIGSAELCVRTGPGRFRKVLWYVYGSQYGNDLVRDGREPSIKYSWAEYFVADFYEFLGPLFRGQGNDLVSEEEQEWARKWHLEHPHDPDRIGPAID